jgi:hypothetical protein
MEHAEETLVRLVSERLKALNTNAFAVEKAANLPEDAIRSILRGGKKSGTTMNRARAVCDALGIEFSFGGPTKPMVIEHITLAGADYARIPVHDARLSAGPGEMNDGVAIIDHMAFRQDWLRKIDVKPENALIARVAGDSMAPAIQSGDLVMIDKTRRDVPAFKKTRLPQQLPIFAFRQDDQARVKRLERRVKEKLLILYSDNPTLPAEVIGEGDVQSLEILGQVVWSGHVWR